MHEISLLASWANFYVIAGSSAAALTGLMFVVITLVAGEEDRASEHGIAVYSTPVVAHFCAALFIALWVTAPWHALTGLAVTLAALGILGSIYLASIAYRQQRAVTTYRPDLSDLLWYSVFPLLAYLVVLGAAARLVAAPEGALFALAAAEIALIFIGIHNAWDVVTFLARGDDRRAN